MDFTGARDSERQWYQLGRMQVCNSLQTNNHSTSLLKFFFRPSCRPINSVKALKASRQSDRFKKGSPYSITERRVPELIPVLGSQPAGSVSHKPGVGCHYFPPGLQLPPQPLRGLLPISLLGEQRHNGCEQFA